MNPAPKDPVFAALQQRLFAVQQTYTQHVLDREQTRSAQGTYQGFDATLGGDVCSVPGGGQLLIEAQTNGTADRGQQIPIYEGGAVPLWDGMPR